MPKENKSKFRVFFGEIEGDDETIRDALRTIGAAVNKTFSGEVRIVKVIESASGEQAVAIPATTEETTDSFNEEPTESPARKPKARNRKPASYDFVNDLNLQPQGRKSLRDFFAEKSPRTQQEQLVVVVHYLIKTLKTSAVGINHVYTGFKNVDKPVPDIRAMLGKISERKGWLDTSNYSDIKLTAPGENFVEHDLPNKGDAAKAG